MPVRNKVAAYGGNGGNTELVRLASVRKASAILGCLSIDVHGILHCLSSSCHSQHEVATRRWAG